MWINHIVLSKATLLLDDMGQKTVHQFNRALLDYYFDNLYSGKSPSSGNARFHWSKLFMACSFFLFVVHAELLQPILVIEPDVLVYACYPRFIFIISFFGEGSGKIWSDRPDGYLLSNHLPIDLSFL